MFKKEELITMAYNGFYTSLVKDFLESNHMDKLEEFQATAKQMVIKYSKELEKLVCGYLGVQMKQEGDTSFLEYIESQGKLKPL